MQDGPDRAWSLTPNMTDLTKEKYINLETLRKTGQPMLTPVWFVEDAGAVFVRTIAASGKVKRARNNPAVRFAPCTSRGQITGNWQSGQAMILSADQDARINALFNQKYGLLKRLFDLAQRGKSYDVIKVVPAG